MKRPVGWMISRLANRLVTRRLVQQLLLPFGRDLQPQRWIFVVGCYNSGTTLLATILRHHPDIGGLWTEGAFLTDALPYPEQKGWPRMWSKCIDHVRLLPGPGGEERAARIRRHWSLWFPKGKPNLVEKTVSSGARMPFLEAYFQPAYFVHIRRNGYAVASGIRGKANLRRWKNSYANQGGYPIELCAEQWRLADEYAERDGALLDRFLTITYEGLTERAQDTLGRITDFLGLNPFPEEMTKQEWVVHEGRSQMTNMNPSSFRRLSEEDLDKIDRVAGDRLRMHGYQRPVLDSEGIDLEAEDAP